VLCDRIFEQIAGWAGVVDRRRFTSQYLRTSWALRRIRLEISNSWAAIHSARLNFDPSLSRKKWEEIKQDTELGYEPGAGGRYTIDLRGVLLRLDFLLECVEPDTPLHERLLRLKRRTANGRSTADWVEDLVGEFDAFQSRERRVRNGLVHGGPIDDEMAASVVLFMDWLAAESLHTAIKGLLADHDLIDHFLDRREEYEYCWRRLRRNEPAVEAMFWE
jgi:hypothetical protein